MSNSVPVKADLFIRAILALAFSLSQAEESKPQSFEGIREARLVTAARAIVPGETLTVGFLLDPKPGFHTYWRGPGVVGVATQLEWSLPEKFVAGEILWPIPIKTDMAGIVANGYEEEVILLTDIQCPAPIEGDMVTIRVKAAWMACATSCHPSVGEFSLTLPVARTDPPEEDEEWAGRFEEIRDSLPETCPEKWKFSISRPADDHIILTGTVPGLTLSTAESLVFFSDDMQVDSDTPSRFEWIDSSAGSFRLHFKRPDFAPSDPPRFSGILCHAQGWPGLPSSCVEISLPWNPDKATP